MTRIKKARSPGQIATRKDSRETQEQSKERKRKAKRKGLAAGSRQQVAASGQPGGQQGPKDPRHGSKKPIALLPAESAKAKPKTEPVAKAGKKEAPIKALKTIDTVPELTLEQELEQLENNERLNSLLDKVDAGEKLGKTDAAWLDKTLARHQQLLEELGLIEEDEDAEPADGDDLWTRFMDAEFDPAQYEDKEDKS